MTIIRFDECISHRIVDALRAIRPPQGIQLEIPQELAQLGQPDIDWIADFSARGGRLIVSGDGNMRRVQLERAALEASGLVAVFPHMKWYGSLGRWGQAGFFMTWFPSIVRLAEEAEPGSHFRIPASLSGEFASIERLKPLAEIEQEREQKLAARAAAERGDG